MHKYMRRTELQTTQIVNTDAISKGVYLRFHVRSVLSVDIYIDIYGGSAPRARARQSRAKCEIGFSASQPGRSDQLGGGNEVLGMFSDRDRGTATATAHDGQMI